MKLKSSHFLSIICLYFTLSFIPIFAGWKVEIFPFFSFKLFSKTPQSFEHVDVLLNGDLDNPKLLIHGNQNLSQIEAKFYAAKAAKMVSTYLGDPKSSNSKFELNGHSGQLVILTGDYIDAARFNSFNIHVVGNEFRDD